MKAHRFILIGLFAAAFFAGRASTSRMDSGPRLDWSSVAFADEVVRHGIDSGWNWGFEDDVVRHGLGGHEEFISTSGGNAYIWRRTNDNEIELVGQCAVLEEDVSGQASYVWLPGVERRP